MGSGSWSEASYSAYSRSVGASYDSSTKRVSGQSFKSVKIDPSLDPKKFLIRECVNSPEHPNTVPVILALDVTGSMGRSCSETAAALGVIMTNLYKKYKDIEFCVMGIGDLAYDDAPIQMSQFESDVRIAEALDKIYMEHGGGGNSYESYTAAWYMGLNRTKLDAVDNQNRKGIIITMGDEPLNPYLPCYELNKCAAAHEQGSNIETPDLYKEASKKFDIYHIAVEDKDNSFRRWKDDIMETFGKTLGDRLKVSTVNNLANTIEACIDESMNGCSGQSCMVNENSEISW